MTIALFGGSFNPPHVAHQLVALYVLETHADVEALWFVPTFTHVFGKSLAPFEHRYAMCELAAAPLGARAVVSDVERTLAQRPEFTVNRTLDLIEYLEGSTGQRFRLVVGADILGETDKWHRWDEVARRAPPIVVSRPGFPGGTGVAIDVSSTKIRELLAAGDREGASALVPASVLRYIAANQLYQ